MLERHARVPQVRVLEGDHLQEHPQYKENSSDMRVSSECVQAALIVRIPRFPIGSLGHRLTSQESDSTETSLVFLFQRSFLQNAEQENLSHGDEKY